MACGVVPVPVAVKVAIRLPLLLSFTSIVQFLMPVEVGVNFTMTVGLVLLLTLIGVVGETITNCEQPPPASNTTVTTTFVPPVALSVVFIVLDWLTTTLPKSIEAGVLKAACATPLRPIQIPSSNSPNQCLDIAMPLRSRRQLPGRDRRRAYTSRNSTRKRPPRARAHCNILRRLQKTDIGIAP